MKQNDKKTKFSCLFKRIFMLRNLAYSLNIFFFHSWQERKSVALKMKLFDTIQDSILSGRLRLDYPEVKERRIKIKQFL